MQRIIVFGGVASGKTTFSRKLSKTLKIPIYTTDDMVYKSIGKEKYSDEERDNNLKKIVNEKEWVLEGVHGGEWLTSAVKRAELIIILDINILIRYYRVFKRYFERRNSENPDTLRDTLKLASWVYEYKSKNFREHIAHARRNKVRFVILRSKADVLRSLKVLKN